LLCGHDEGSTEFQRYERLLHDGALETRKFEHDLPDPKPGGERIVDEHGGMMMGSLELISLFQQQPKSKKRKLTVAEWRPIMTQHELDKLINQEVLKKKALESVEQHGIVFIDEIDKICRSSNEVKHGSDASAEGVQRDLLPLIEGTMIHTTKLGNVDTSKILFIASGAFHSCKPSDLLAELQGRLPIRVELKGLDKEDLRRILTEPEASMIRQQIELMKTEGIDLAFTPQAVNEIARIAAEVNKTVENIGARRLHTVLERIVEDASYNCDKYAGQKIVIDAAYVNKHLGDMLLKTDLSRFIL